MRGYVDYGAGFQSRLDASLLVSEPDTVADVVAITAQSVRKVGTERKREVAVAVLLSERELVLLGNAIEQAREKLRRRRIEART